jgi:hypothetical protein
MVAHAYRIGIIEVGIGAERTLVMPRISLHIPLFRIQLACRKFVIEYVRRLSGENRRRTQQKGQQTEPNTLPVHQGSQHLFTPRRVISSAKACNHAIYPALEESLAYPGIAGQRYPKTPLASAVSRK